MPKRKKNSKFPTTSTRNGQLEMEKQRIRGKPPHFNHSDTKNFPFIESSSDSIIIESILFATKKKTEFSKTYTGIYHIYKERP